ncbi:hypothetical protein RIR_jg23674.t1 [Rhizophagus irregularis DAOM 181602=DAOM 197198]|nr:hypothetical protein RIR_jg23674.t1 [Rhizophagus irregularis DAOM 181602=DAOM 197198]
MSKDRKQIRLSSISNTIAVSVAKRKSKREPTIPIISKIVYIYYINVYERDFGKCMVQTKINYVRLIIVVSFDFLINATNLGIWDHLLICHANYVLTGTGGTQSACTY